MRNLIAFLQRFRIFLLFAILQIFALNFYFGSSEFAKIQFLSTTSSINGDFMSVRNDITKHFNLSTTNARLLLENKRLLKKLKQSHYQVEKGIVQIDDTAHKQTFSYLPANVIQGTYYKRNNFLTIDLGAIHGLKKGDGVISSNGLVGTVHTVGKNYSLVKTLLSQNINIDVMLESNGAFGLLKWNGFSPRTVQISGINSDIVVKKWWKVVTRTSSGIFPQGIPVGKVYTRKPMEGKPLWEISLFTAVDFRRIQHVYVLKNIHSTEIQELQGQIPPDKVEEI